MKNYYQTPHYRSISVSYVGATTHKGARVKIADTRMKETVFIPYDYSIGDIGEQAYLLLQEAGYNIVGFSSDDNTVSFLCYNWDENYVSVKDVKSK